MVVVLQRLIGETQIYSNLRGGKPVAGELISGFVIGLSFGRMDRAEGALDALGGSMGVIIGGFRSSTPLEP